MTTFNPAECEKRFVAFFEAIHGHGPFPWQRRLAVRVCDPAKGWPRAIALPTAAGKTSCIDISVFALAYQVQHGHPRTAPRRIFFVVDRRIVVDQAYEHAKKKLVPAMAGATSGVLREVADVLRGIGDGDRPLDVYALRGGMYREDTWVRSPLQPTVVTSTVDQVGSRLLFRGYGVSDSMAPVHAGLVGNDALLLLDEAHCSKPFAETAEAVAKYRGWNKELAPFRFVQMTATPAGDVPEDQIERDQEDDRNHPFLGKRINASKPTALVVTDKVKGKKWQEPLEQKLVKEARGLMGRAAEDGSDSVQTVGVIVNRVATARGVAAALRSEGVDVLLLTGRMRPLDRDGLLRRLRPLFTGSDEPLPRPTYVVATQCLEVGADLDFHALVSECASLDALRQRFGRLNRHAQKRKFAPGVVVVRADQAEDSEDDPVYGSALAETWKWLTAKATDGTFDFGVSAVRAATTGEDLSRLNAPTASAPVLLPAHLDCWVQTSPRPEPDPDPALFLHGPKSGPPDVQVVFRADLGEDRGRWSEIVSLCPPSSSEALPVKIGAFKRWLADADQVPDDVADVEGTADDADEPAPVRPALWWNGPDKSALVERPEDVRPTRTYVVPAGAPGLELLGDFPTDGLVEGRPADHGEEAFQRSRDRAVLRLTEAVVNQWPTPLRRAVAAALGVAVSEDEAQPPPIADLRPALQELGRRYDDNEDVSDELRAVLDALHGGPEWLTAAAAQLRPTSNRAIIPHPAGGLVLTGKRRIGRFSPTFADDESSESPTRRQVSLEEHTRDVMEFAEHFASGCGLAPNLKDRIALAARWHDLGKADPRFQAMLRGGSPRSAAGRQLLAKSGAAPASRSEREEARKVHRYPKGGRHEHLSLAFAAERSDDDLILHLTGTHHGDDRPFAAPYDDDTIDQARDLLPIQVTLLGEQFPWPKAAGDPATVNVTAPDRFWRVVRTYGWWGEAYLAALFRLADHAASRAEQEEGWRPNTTDVPTSPGVPQSVETRPLREAVLAGLDGSNPLAFLAALGVLRCLTVLARRSDRPGWLDGQVKLSWGCPDSPLGAVLHVAGSPTPGEIAAFLANGLSRSLTDHPANSPIALMEEKDGDPAALLREMRRGAASDGRDPADWATALHADLLPGATSQLLMVRRDYFPDNVRSVMRLTAAEHLERALFRRWDYADPLENRSLHWEPSEDRRHAYQWHQPNGDPTRGKRGGMLGANRLALEAWPLFLSLPKGDKLRTRGFTGDGVKNTFWTWPLWSCPVGLDAVASLLALAELQESSPKPGTLRAYRVFTAFRCQRILVGKTPNLTPAAAV